MSVAAIILAAGSSSRLGQPKQLVKVGSETLLERTIRLANEAGASPVIVVLGANRDRILAEISITGAVPIFNEQWEQGMATSIHAGLAFFDSTELEVTGALMMACDQPRTSANQLRELLAAFSKNDSEKIVVSAYAEILGIPAVFPVNIFPELRKLQGDRGARGLFAHPRYPLVIQSFDGGEIDIDRPEDLIHIN